MHGLHFEIAALYQADPDRLAQAVRPLIHQPELARKLAAAGRKLLAEFYIPDAQASAPANPYPEVLRCA